MLYLFCINPVNWSLLQTEPVWLRVMLIPNETTQAQTQQTLRTDMTIVKSSSLSSIVWLKDRSPLISSFEHIHNRLQLWHRTKYPALNETKKRKKIDDEQNTYSLPSNETLNPDVMRCFDIGTARGIDYMQCYYIDKPYAVDRSEKEVPLQRILATSIDRNKKERTKVIDRSTSLSKNDLDKAMDKEEAAKQLLAVINALNQLPNSTAVPLIPPTIMNKINKAERIKLLVKHRNRLFVEDSAALSRLESKSVNEFD